MRNLLRVMIALASLAGMVTPTQAANEPAQATHTETPAKSIQTLRDCPECPEMVVIPAGSFDMGSKEGYTDERPIHLVTFSRPFALGRTEVTQAQWRAIMGSDPSKFSNCGDNCPVEQVGWNDVQQFIQKLNAKTGKQYRLPSEAEWEYAARADTVTAYYWGNDAGRNNANCDGCGSRWDGKQTSPVGSFPPNPFGLYDMSGNVFEWVADDYHDNYKGAPTDGKAWEGDGTKHVLRGGSWNHVPPLARVSVRLKNVPTLRYFSDFGFRLARTLP